MNELTINLTKTPIVLLIGNGISRSCSSVSTKSWDELIRELRREYNSEFSMEEIAKLPYPMMILAATNDDVPHAMKRYASELSNITLSQNDTEFLKKIMTASPIDAVLTTNYSYELETSVLGAYTPYKYRKVRRTTKEVKGPIFRKRLFQYSNISEETPPIWHIHGEACAPQSMIMGHYHYGKLLREIQDYIPDLIRRYKKALSEGQETMEAYSWIDYFLIGNVHMLGFAWDLSESDLWWLACCKKRNFTETEIVFHTMRRNEIDGTGKQLMMKLYGVKIECPEVLDYRGYYEKTIEHI